MSYSFASISDHEFELICADLVSEMTGHRVEVFSPGRDQGIDFRILAGGSPDEPNRVLIGQCKKWRADRFDDLLRELKKTELPKVEELDPERYLLFTTVTLNPNRKASIRSTMSPYIQSEADIFGPEEIGLLLAKYASVVRRHVKLWLTSSEMLDAIVHAATKFRVDDFKERLPRQLELWAPNESFSAALETVRQTRVCVISGPPGIGKSMLADVLLAQLMSEEYEPVVISRDIAEGAQRWRNDAKQVFHYDDFLGRISLGEMSLAKNEDAEIARFVDRVARSTDKYLIMTTREYILREAYVRFEPLTSEGFAPHKHVLGLSDYSRLNRATILYNHLYFSSLSADLKQAVVPEKFYNKILDHRRYSPRVIDQIIAEAEIAIESPERLRQRFVETLDDPGAVWAAAFDSLPATCRTVLRVLASMPREAEIQDLRSAVEAFAPDLFPDATAFDSGLQTLENTFIAIRRPELSIAAQLSGRVSLQRFVRFRDPSVADFLWKRLHADQPTVERMVEAAAFFEQPLILANGHVDQDSGSSVLADRAQAITRLISLVETEPVTYDSTSEPDWVRHEADLAERLNTVLELAKRVGHVDRVHTIANAIQSMIDQPDRRVDKAFVVALTKSLGGEEQYSAIRSRLFSWAVPWFVSSLEDIEDLTALHQLHRVDAVVVEDLTGVDGDWEETVDACREIVKQEFDFYYHDSDDPGRIECVAQEIEELSSFFTFDEEAIVHGLLERAEEVRSEIGESEPDYDDDRYRSYGRDRDDGRSVDSMFESL